MSHGIVRRVSRTVVEKLKLRDDCLHLSEQKRIHRHIQSILHNYQLLRVPELLDSIDSHRYRMRKIKTTHPLHLGLMEDHNLADEVRRLWLRLWEDGFAAWDFELYLQPDGKVMMIDFDRFGYRMYLENLLGHIPIDRRIHLPITIQSGTFFQNVCFPADFQQSLGNI